MLRLSSGDELTREQLKAEIFSAAMRLYPWLRSNSDPRRFQEGGEAAPASKFFDRLSNELSDLVSRRGQIVMAVNQSKRRRSMENKKQIAKLQTELQELEKEIELKTLAFKTVPEIAGDEITPESKDWRLVVFEEHPEAAYFFGGVRLADCYIKSVGFRCPSCHQLVMRTKTPRHYGAGLKMIALSCWCRSILVDPDSSVVLTQWELLLKRIASQ